MTHLRRGDGVMLENSRDLLRYKGEQSALLIVIYAPVSRARRGRGRKCCQGACITPRLMRARLALSRPFLKILYCSSLVCKSDEDEQVPIISDYMKDK